MDEKYLYLFNVLTESIERIEALKEMLMEAQQKAEEMYIREGSKQVAETS